VIVELNRIEYNRMVDKEASGFNACDRIMAVLLQIPLDGHLRFRARCNA
jgi:hypothetical protein